MKHPRRHTVVVVTGVTGLLAVSACLAGGTSGPRSTAAVPAVASETPDPSAEFVVPLYVPTPPSAVPSPASDPGVLGPDSVITPGPTGPTVPPHAVFRPA